MKILLFADLAERLGVRELQLAAPFPPDVESLRRRLADDHEALSGAVFRVAVNHSYVGEDAALTRGDEIALIPPVSGG